MIRPPSRLSIVIAFASFGFAVASLAQTTSDVKST